MRAWFPDLLWSSQPIEERLSAVRRRYQDLNRRQGSRVSGCSGGSSFVAVMESAHFAAPPPLAPFPAAESLAAGASPSPKQDASLLHDSTENNRRGFDAVAKELKSFFLGLDISDSTRGKYRAVMSRVFSWGISEELIPEFIEAPSGGYVSSNPCCRVKGSEFSRNQIMRRLLWKSRTLSLSSANSSSRNTSWRC